MKKTILLIKAAMAAHCNPNIGPGRRMYCPGTILCGMAGIHPLSFALFTISQINTLSSYIVYCSISCALFMNLAFYFLYSKDPNSLINEIIKITWPLIGFIGLIASIGVFYTPITPIIRLGLYSVLAIIKILELIQLASDLINKKFGVPKDLRPYENYSNILYGIVLFLKHCISLYFILIQFYPIMYRPILAAILYGFDMASLIGIVIYMTYYIFIIHPESEKAETEGELEEEKEQQKNELLEVIIEVEKAPSLDGIKRIAEQIKQSSGRLQDDEAVKRLHKQLDKPEPDIKALEEYIEQQERNEHMDRYLYFGSPSIKNLEILKEVLINIKNEFQRRDTVCDANKKKLKLKIKFLSEVELDVMQGIKSMLDDLKELEKLISQNVKSDSMTLINYLVSVLNCLTIHFNINHTEEMKQRGELQDLKVQLQSNKEAQIKIQNMLNFLLQLNAHHNLEGYLQAKLSLGKLDAYSNPILDECKEIDTAIFDQIKNILGQELFKKEVPISEIRPIIRVFIYYLYIILGQNQQSELLTLTKYILESEGKDMDIIKEKLHKIKMRIEPIQVAFLASKKPMRYGDKMAIEGVLKLQEDCTLQDIRQQLQAVKNVLESPIYQM